MKDNYISYANWSDELQAQQMLQRELLEQFGSKAYASPFEGGYYGKLERFNDGSASLSYYCGRLVGATARRDPRKVSSLPEPEKLQQQRLKAPEGLSRSKFGTIRKDHLNRTRQTLERHVRNNKKSLKSFVTLTFDPKRCQGVDTFSTAETYFNLWNKKLKIWAKRHGVELLYVGVPEFQKNGNVHYHLMTNFTDSNGLLIPQEDKKGCFDVRGWDFGFTSAFYISGTDEKFSCVAYMLKYLYKDLDDRLFSHRKIKQSGLDTTRRLVYFNNVNEFNIHLRVLSLFSSNSSMWYAVNKDNNAYYINFRFDLSAFQTQ